MWPCKVAFSLHCIHFGYTSLPVAAARVARLAAGMGLADLLGKGLRPRTGVAATVNDISTPDIGV